MFIYNLVMIVLLFSFSTASFARTRAYLPDELGNAVGNTTGVMLAASTLVYFFSLTEYPIAVRFVDVSLASFIISCFFNKNELPEVASNGNKTTDDKK